MSELQAETAASTRYAPDYKLNREEVAVEASALYGAFNELLDNDSDVKRERDDSDNDSTFPMQKIDFYKGDVVYNVGTSVLRDESGAERGKQLYLLRSDKMNNEEVLTIDVGEVPRIDYKSVYAGGVGEPPKFEPFDKDKKDLRPVVMSTGYKVDRDYVVDIGLAISGAREMLERMRKDFGK